MGTPKLIFILLLTNATIFSNGQKSISRYSINLLSDRANYDTIKVNLSYKDCFGEKKGIIKLSRIDANYFIQVFWQKIIDSAGLFIDGYSLDTAYYVSSTTLVNNLKKDFRKSKPKKIPELTTTTYTFIITDKINEVIKDREGVYLYHRLRYNSFLKL